VGIDVLTPHYEPLTRPSGHPLRPDGRAGGEGPAKVQGSNARINHWHRTEKTVCNHSTGPMVRMAFRLIRGERFGHAKWIVPNPAKPGVEAAWNFWETLGNHSPVGASIY